MKKFSDIHYHFRLQHLLESQNYTVLQVRSSDVPVDFIALRNGMARAYRCKFHGRIHDAEMQNLIAFAKQTGIKVFVAKENGEHAIRLREVKE